MSGIDFATNAIFNDSHLFEQEMHTLFLNEWMFAGVLDQLPLAGSWFTFDMWDRSIIVGRDDEDRLHASVNSCSHRGTRLCRPGENGSGRIQCPYHGWTYDCSGKLIGASRRAGLPAFDNADYGLAVLTAERAGRFIFVHPQAKPPKSLRETMNVARLEQISSRMASSFLAMSTAIQGNWKFAVSGTIEDYHVNFVHAYSVNQKRHREAGRPVLGEHGDSDLFAPLRGNRVERFLRREPSLTYESYFFFPNLVLIRFRDFVYVAAFIPRRVDYTIRLSRLYDCSSNNTSRLRRRVLTMLRPVIARAIGKGFEEDRYAVEEAHIGSCIGRARPRGPAHEEELRVEHFLKEIARRLVE